ncbi:MAG: NYN domain-containing protein, partial [Gemmatimonadaceae bacterium]
MHRGPQAISPAVYGAPAPFHHAPNAALLIDFDNVTMGIRSDLGNELRNLLGSDIIKGKVAVQRAYADWRRYPQYIVPLAESSIDMIMAPAYGSSKKNATDIRLSVDAMELVFTRPEIGTYILLSGDSDFASLVTKLKEYGKYVIGVGIRESSSDLLVMNCDEYYSYNSLAGLVKSNDEEQKKWDPWELVVEALGKMKRNGDVMRSDRLKQVMQELDATFDEKDLGMAKFSRFVQEAATRGLVKLTRLENGQLEVGLADRTGAVVAGDGAPAPVAHVAAPPVGLEQLGGERGTERRPERDESRGDGDSRGRRGGRGRGRGRGERPDRGERGAGISAPTNGEPALAHLGASMRDALGSGASSPFPEPETRDVAPEPAPQRTAAATGSAALAAELTGERLTRDEAFDLVRRAVGQLTAGGDAAVRASDVRRAARDLLGRDSESLSERFFVRILRDAHDADLIDLRKRGDDYEVASAVRAQPIAQQLQEAEAIAAPQPDPSQAGRSAANAAALRRGIRQRGPTGRGGRGGVLPPELLNIGVVEEFVPMPTSAAVPDTAADASEPNIVPSAEDLASEPESQPARPARPARPRGGRGRSAGKATAGARGAAAPVEEPVAVEKP